MENIEEKIKALSVRAQDIVGSIETEEATKNALIMPFLAALGYDIFDPSILTPEFTADIGIKKGEKVDYAIKKDGRIVILIECKPCKSDLSRAHMGQLFRYFMTTEARFAILTNGIDYWFYSDIDSENKMDESPFFRFNLFTYRPNQIAQLKKFSRKSFDVDAILGTASNLKYGSEVKSIFLSEIENPSEDIVRFFVSKVFSGRFTKNVKEEFTVIVKNAIQEAIRDQISDRLSKALEASQPQEQHKEEEAQEAEIETTEEEIEGFYIIKSICSKDINPNRIFMRDAKSYCAIILDDNNRKTIARLRFNSARKKKIGVFSKKEEKIFDISDPQDIYKYSENILKTIREYEETSEQDG
ncbi:MAG TPA: restriction endonuclease [Rhodospirillaceae bacterium]|jgi:hypothetical protein|nr:type I restriction enzyme HsdR N-terminal domain-containing protein [Alphaproteobacteria bacterium]HBH26228.1 restriction endonuclease [Rhodospirillaceae bacterium]